MRKQTLLILLLTEPAGFLCVSLKKTKAGASQVVLGPICHYRAFDVMSRLPVRDCLSHVLNFLGKIKDMQTR